MSAKPTPKKLKSVLNIKANARKRVRVSEDAHAKVNSTQKSFSKSKGKQRETVASPKAPSSLQPRKDRPQPKATSSISRPPSAFKLVTGSYEKLLYGLEGSITLGEKDGNRISVKLEPIFIFPAHVSCVKAVSGSPVGGKWLATGSVDEIVKVWDLKRKKEVGGLMQHQGLFPPISARRAIWLQSLILSCCIRFYYGVALPLAISSYFCVRGWYDSHIPYTRLGCVTGFEGT